MSSKKQGAAKKAAPKKATPRKKPGPAARAKARQAKEYPAVVAVPPPPIDVASSFKARTDALAAQARLDNARAEELEIQNRFEREMKGYAAPPSGPSKPAFTFAGEHPSDQPLTASEAIAKAPAPINDFRREMGDLRDSLSSLESITDALAKRLDPVLRAPEPTLAAGDVGEDGRNRSPVAQEVYDQRHRVDMVFLLVSRIHDRLDLPH